MTAEQLRNSILQQAISGRLVPQDPNDEPASVLLDKIRDEKARLIKEGKLKKEKPSAPITEEEKPFEIPASWEWVRFGEYMDIIGGYAFPSDSIKGNEGPRVIRISDISEKGFVDKSVVRYKGKPIHDAYKIAQNDILIAMTGGTVGKSLLVLNLPEEMYLNQRVAMIRNIWFNIKYIDTVIKAPHIKEIINERKNSTNDNISMVDIKNFMLPLPPLAEQQRIVAKLEELLPIVEQYGKAQAELDELNAALPARLRQSILQQAFSGALTQSDADTWEWLPMKEVTKLMCDGDWIEKKDQSFQGIRLVQTGNVGDGHFIDKPGSYKYISEETYRRLSCTEIYPGDILISRLPSPVGRSCIIPNFDYRMITAVDCSIIRLKDNILREFFVLYTQSTMYHNKLSKMITGTTRARISRGNLEKIVVPLPPLAEQQRIVAKIEELFAEIDKLK